MDEQIIAELDRLVKQQKVTDSARELLITALRSLTEGEKQDLLTNLQNS